MRIKICPIGRDIGDGRMIKQGADLTWWMGTTPIMYSDNHDRKLVALANQLAVEDNWIVGTIQLIGDGEQLWAAGHRPSPEFEHTDWEFYTPTEWDELTGVTGSLGGAVMTRGQVVRFALVPADQAPGGDEPTVGCMCGDGTYDPCPNCGARGGAQ